MTKRELPKELYKWSKKMTRMRRKKKLKMIINCTIRNQNPQLIKKRTMTTTMKKKDMKKSKSTITSSSPRQTREGRFAV